MNRRGFLKTIAGAIIATAITKELTTAEPSLELVGYAGFKFTIDPWPLRYFLDPHTGDFKQVMPALLIADAQGFAAAPNPSYVTAPYEYIGNDDGSTGEIKPRLLNGRKDRRWVSVTMEQCEDEMSRLKENYSEIRYHLR